MDVWLIRLMWCDWNVNYKLLIVIVIYQLASFSVLLFLAFFFLNNNILGQRGEKKVWERKK